MFSKQTVITVRLRFHDSVYQRSILIDSDVSPVRLKQHWLTVTYSPSAFPVVCFTSEKRSTATIYLAEFSLGVEMEI